MADSPAMAAAEPGEAPGKPQDADVNLAQQARSILKMSRETEFLHSFLRVDHGDSDSEAGDSPPRVPGSGPAGAQKADEPADGPGGGGGGGGAAAAGRAHHAGDDPPSRRHHKATFKEVVKDLEMYGGLGALAGMRKGAKGRRGRVIRGEEVYTDKDRAAAVQMGHRDIKQSLRMKRHQERVHALQLPEEADGSTLIALGQYELRQGNTDIAIAFVNKALQLCPEDKTALVARSKCYLLLGQPRLALQDAETALEPDRNFVRAIFQKAEALYHMGDFEHSLMYYHRGLRLRPELAVFRLGVQKAQEAIENTIGRSKGSMRARLASPSSGRHSASGHSSGSAAPSPAPGAAVGGLGPRPAVVTPTADAAADHPAGLAASRVSSPTTPSTLPTQPTLTTPGSARSRSSRSSRDNRYPGGGDASSTAGAEEQSARRLLGELCVDKLYLEQLLRHPDIQCARKDRNRSAQIAVHAEDGVEFLRNRQEFWRQQKLSAAPAPPPAAAAAPPGAGGGARRRMGTPASGGSTARDAVVPAATATPVS